MDCVTYQCYSKQDACEKKYVGLGEIMRVV